MNLNFPPFFFNISHQMSTFYIKILTKDVKELILCFFTLLQLCLWWKLYICYSFYNSIPFLFSGGSNINQNISLPQFDLRVNLSDNYATDYYDLSYPGVIMRIVLSRKMSFHLWQTYIPSSIFVVVAWLSTFVPPEQVPGKFYNLIVWSTKNQKDQNKDR